MAPQAEPTPAQRAWSSTAPPGEFKPFIPPEQSPGEFTLRAILLGAVFGILFGAVTVYVGLRAGLTVSASIPIAVLSISILRAFGRATILENNIVQTIGSAGESVAAGVIFTLPALIFLGFQLEYSRIFLLAMIGGWLGVLFMIPLRRQLIVKEHGNLLYPEGTACADVLVAGERGGSFAGRVFWGLGLGGVYTFLMKSVGLWRERPLYEPSWLPGASFRADITTEYMGVGYIIGPRIAGVIFAGGVFSWLVMMPAIKFFGSLMPDVALYPSTVPIPQMTSDQLWASYIRPMGAGAVAAAGLITLMKTMPTIVAALAAGLKDVRAERAGTATSASRVERDLSMRTVIFGSIAILVMMWILLTFKPIPGAQTGWFANLMAGLFVVVFGFLFVTVSSRIVGLIGSSANPISGMTIATLMATCAIFLLLGWTGGAFAALALTIGGVVCIAAANAGATSQDLKTGHLVGATPSRQQLGLMIGVMASVFVIGGTLILMNQGLAQYKPIQLPLNLAALPEGVQVEGDHVYEGKTYTLVNAIGSREIPDGKYLFDRQTNQIEVQWVQGIGSEQAAAPQARLMATVINGILNQRLPWRLVLLGVFLVIAVELLGIRSLAFAVGSYLSIATTMAIFTGGVVRWLAERGTERKEHESEVSPGSLFSSGLIAAGGLLGLFAIGVKVIEDLGWIPRDVLHIGPSLLGDLTQANWPAVLMFGLLAASLFLFARKKLD
ncbi:MAG: oligopeptide transporter, OPT family [Acidobacteria bacterium]|nr:oligopeptide transporter, OPT family [Acidobacteriota bacterium]